MSRNIDAYNRPISATISAEELPISGINVLGNRVLVCMRSVEEKSKGGIYLAPKAVEIETMANIYGRLASIGPDAICSANIGDLVVISKYAGVAITGKDGKTLFRVINDNDIVGLLDNDFFEVNDNE